MEKNTKILRLKIYRIPLNYSLLVASIEIKNNILKNSSKFHFMISQVILIFIQKFSGLNYF